MRTTSNVTPSIFSLFDTVMGQPATVAVDDSGVLDNFCPVPKKQTSDLSGFRLHGYMVFIIKNRLI